MILLEYTYPELPDEEKRVAFDVMNDSTNSVRPFEKETLQGR